MIQLADAVISLSDVLIVGAAAGVRAAAIYAVAQRLGLLPVRIVQPRTTLLFSKAGELAARDNRSGLRDSTDEVVRYVQYLAIPAAIVLGFLAGPTIEAWVGPLYREAATVIGLLCLAAVCRPGRSAQDRAQRLRAVRRLPRCSTHRGRVPRGPRHRAWPPATGASGMAEAV